MAHFDDIPIAQIHKAEGYFTRKIDDSEIKGGEASDDEIEGQNLKDMVVSAKWKTRMIAFKKIN